MYVLQYHPEGKQVIDQPRQEKIEKNYPFKPPFFQYQAVLQRERDQYSAGQSLEEWNQGCKGSGVCIRNVHNTKYRAFLRKALDFGSKDNISKQNEAGI